MKKVFRDAITFYWLDENCIVQEEIETKNKLVIKNTMSNKTDEYEIKEDFQTFLKRATKDKLDIVCYTSLRKDFDIKSYIIRLIQNEKEIRISFSMIDGAFYVSCSHFEINDENAKEIIPNIKNIVKSVKEYIKTSPETRLKYLHVEYKYGHMVEEIMK